MIDKKVRENCDCGWSNSHNGETLDNHNLMEHDNWPFDILADAEQREAKNKEIAAQEHCEPSQRVDGKLHSFRFDGDDPYVICVFCGQMRDAIKGDVIK